MAYMTIDARAVWVGDARECRKLYKQFSGAFGGNFWAIRKHYGWKRASMLKALKSVKA